MKLAILFVLLTACTDFTDITRSVCGNGLLEPGEDCDSEVASCVRCAVTCDAKDDCPSANYACGNDGFCHAPGGELADPSSPVQFQADDFRITDLDRDGAGDVVGVSKTSVIIRKGDAAGALTATSSFVTPAQSGAAAFGDLDGDGTIDVTLATPDGIVELTSRFGSLSPVAIESPLFAETGEPLDFVRLFQPSTLELGGMISIENSIQLVIVAFVGEALSATEPCKARLGTLTEASVDLSTLEIYRVTPDGALTNELVVSFLTTSGDICVTSVHGGLLGGYQFDDITPVGAAGRSVKPILADLDTDNDPCPALVNSDGGAHALRQWDGSNSNGHCVLAIAGANGAPLPLAPQAPADAIAIGRIELSPRIEGLGRDALVMTSGVYGNIPAPIPFVPAPVMTELYSSTGRRLGFVATGDLDNDGDLDAVLATSDQDDLDVLFRFPAGLQLFRVDTASTISSLTLADVDGNGVRDIAYTEKIGDHHDMLVAYGTADRPLAPIQVASFSGVGAVSVLQFPDSVDTLGIAEDLAVIQPGAGADGNALLSLLHGSPQRTMLSFFDPRSDARRSDTFLYGVVVGDFVDEPPALHRDLVAFGIGDNIARAWRVAGTPLGLDNTPSDGAEAILPGFRSELFAWPAPDLDVVLAVDRDSARATVIDPANFTVTEASNLVDGLPAGVAIRSLHAAELEGSLALVASFQSADAGAVRVCTMSAAGVPERCDDLTPLIVAADPLVTSCIDASPGVISDDGAVDLVVLCRTASQTGLYRVRGDQVFDLGAQATGMQAIRVGDVTGDGLDDVVATINTGTQAVLTFAQCSSRQLGGCRSAQERNQ